MMVRTLMILSIVMLVLAVASPRAAEPLEPAAATPLTTTVEEGEEEAPVKRVKMWARNWDWTPDTIRVKKGTRVIIDFHSEDASHAFHLKAYKIKVNLPQDSKGQVEFVADKVGEFRWRCSRPCGNGCPKMVGTLTVVE